jgi:hypothetical protein
MLRLLLRRRGGPSIASLGLLIAVAGGAASSAIERRVYRYDVEHPVYGRIGSYVNVIQGVDSDARVSSELHIAVKVLGVTLYREDATRTEQWHSNRMTFFDGLTVTNGDAIHVSGAAKGSHFSITSPAGTVLAPADVKPSNPWSLSMLHDGTVMSTKTGKLFAMRVVPHEAEAASAGGLGPGVRRYDVVTNKQETVWVDEHGVAVAFGTEVNGTSIKFVLARE